MLEDSTSNTSVEIVNVAVGALTSLGVRDLTRWVVDYDPDAVLIYTGQNDRSRPRKMVPPSIIMPIRLLDIRLKKIKTYQLTKDIFYILKENTIYFFKLLGISGRDDPERDISQKQSLNYFTSNLEKTIDVFRSNDIPVFVSSLVNNTLLLPIPRKFNQQIWKLTRNSGVQYVPMLEVFRKRSQPKRLGWNLFFDNIHPNIEGQLLMARIFHQTLASDKRFDSRINEKKLFTLNHYKDKMAFSSLPIHLAKHGHWTTLRTGHPYFNDGQIPIGYPSVYEAKSLQDEVAYQIIHEDLSLQEGFQKITEKLLLEGNFERTLQVYRHLRQQEFWNDTWYRRSAQVLRKKGKLNRALFFAKRALQLRSSVKNKLIKVKIQLDRKKFDKALRVLKKIVKNNPNNTKAQKLLAKVTKSQKNRIK